MDIRKRAIFGIGLLVLASVAFLNTAGAPTDTTGSKALDFSAKGSDGKTHTLATLTKNGPVTLYFIKIGCPINNDAVKFYQKIAVANKDGKAPFVGVINGNEAQMKAWQKEYKTSFTILMDPEKKIIGSYKAERSPWIVSVGKDGKVAMEQKGYSVGELDKLNSYLAKANGKTAPKIDFGGAPDVPRFG